MDTESPKVTAFVIRDLEGNEVHRVDVSSKTEHETDRVANGLFLRVDLDRFTVDEEYGE